MDTNVVTETVKTVRFDRDARVEPATRTTTAEFYSDPAGAFKTGFWASQPNRAEINYTYDELCVILDGLVRVTDAAGHVETYRPGDTFLIPRASKGYGKPSSRCGKFYAVYKPK